MPDINLTPLRLDILRLAVSEDPFGRQGIPNWAYLHMKPGPYSAVAFLLSHGILERNIFGYIVPTEEGQRLYQNAMAKENQE